MNSNLEKRDVYDFSTVDSNMTGLYVYRPHSYYSSFTRIVDSRPVEKIQENDNIDMNTDIFEGVGDENTNINMDTTNINNDSISDENTNVFEGIGDTDIFDENIDMTCYEDSCEIFEDMDMNETLQNISAFNTESKTLYPSFRDWGTSDSPFISIPL